MATPSGAQPNFLFFIADQLRCDHLGCYGNTIVKTPAIDALAAAGFASDAFHVASPICMPNRATLMTGRMPSVHGVRHNGIPLSLEATTFVDRLRRAGYRTALIGKSHLQNMAGTPPQWPLDPKDRLPVEARAADGGRYDQEWGPSWAADPAHDLDLPFYGFDAVDLTINHGDDLQGHYRRWLNAAHPGAENLLGPKNAAPAPEFELTTFRQAWRTRIPAELHPNAYCADRAVARLEDYAAARAPFFLMCSFADPHHPYTPPGKYWEMYRPERVELPRSYHAPTDRLPPHVKWLHAERDAGRAVKSTPMLFAATEREVREAIALNYGLISFIDDCVGRVLARLEALGLAENTVVIFTSDHGDYMGDHQLMLKGPIHYRSLIQVPLLWRDPAGPKAKRSGAFAGTIDLAPTILARAGVPGFNGIQGKNLLPLIADGAPLYDAMLVEEEGQRLGLGLPSRARTRTLVTERYRLSIYDGVEWGELYDRAADPDESVNLWDAPAAQAIRAELLLRLVHKMIEVSETSPNPTATA
ncbi:MAG TPA: sulfatase-like hydrolase/transferase [Stellaceae bacterium]|jgi:arylsulfatase A-like enzyme|nr:sulfatase-like hydrolase/transferase [Stellaceae bacterium]